MSINNFDNQADKVFSLLVEFTDGRISMSEFQEVMLRFLGNTIKTWPSNNMTNENLGIKLSTMFTTLDMLYDELGGTTEEEVMEDALALRKAWEAYRERR